MSNVNGTLRRSVLASWSAMRGGGVGALVLKSTSNAFFIFVFCTICARPALASPTLSKMGYVFSYSSYQFLFNFVNYFTRNVDKLLIGKYLGALPLGIYDMSYRLMLMPISNLTHVVTPAIQPIYAEHASNPDVIFESYRKLIRILIIGGGLLGAICLGCAPEIISLGYGNQWSEAIPVFSILSLSVTVQVILSSTGSVFQALGQTRLLFITGVISTITTVSAIVAGICIGDLGVLSSLVAVSFYVNAVQGFFILSRLGFRRSIGEMFKPSYRTLVGVAVVSALAVWLRDEWALFNGALIVSLISKAAIIGVLFAVVVFITGDASFIRLAITRRSRRAVA